MILDENGLPFNKPSAGQEGDGFTVSLQELFKMAQNESPVPLHNDDGSERFTQDAVDLERGKVMLNLIEGIVKHQKHHEFKDPHYLWWNTRKLWDYELRDGNPPGNSDRPEFMRHIRLELDLSIVPSWMKYALYPEGLLDQTVKQAFEKNPEVMPNDMNYSRLKQLLKHQLADKIRKNFLQTRRALN